MGNCTYCGQKAGFMRGHHKECKMKNESGFRELADLAASAIIENRNLKELMPRLKTIATECYLPEHCIKGQLVEGWGLALEKYLDDDILSEQEETSLMKYVEHFELSREELDENGYMTKASQAAVLRDIVNGVIPERVEVEGVLPFNLQKSEKLVWIFPNTTYYTEKSKRHYRGGHTGVSVRVAKGVYLRSGAFKGYPVTTTETVNMGTGLLGVTTKHLYFSGGSKPFRAAYKKIVQFEPYQDGLAIMRDAATAKPQTFIFSGSNSDGWFAFNLITNLAQM